MAAHASIGCRDGISPRKVMLRGAVPADRPYYAGAAGDSPFEPGERLPAGLALARATLAWYHPDVPDEWPIPFDYRVVHTDDDLIVIDKPCFLPTTSNGRLVRQTAQTRLRLQFGEDDIVPLHRLDRLTAGVVVCSRRQESRAAYQQLFARRQERGIEKHYRAWVRPDFWGAGDYALGMRKVRGSRVVQVDPAGVVTRTRVAGHGGFVDLWPATGHTHQLRVLMDHLGSPIIGDDTYPMDRGLDLYDFSQPMLLLAQSVTFDDPFSGTRRTFSSFRDRGSMLE